LPEAILQLLRYFTGCHYSSKRGYKWPQFQNTYLRVRSSRYRDVRRSSMTSYIHP